MQKVLFIAYQFPPRGGPGVHRSLNFVKYLREFGYDPIVLTVNEEDIRKAGHALDETLLSKLPPDITIVRTPSQEPVRLIRSLMRWRIYRFAWFFFYRWLWEWSARWPQKTYPIAATLIREHNIKLVYTSSSPYSALLLGKMLKEKLGVKWVADLRDPFTDAYFWQFPSKFHWKNRRKFEARIWGIPDKLIVNTPEVKKLYMKRKLVSEHKLICITNGY
jgi:glycosyltransferase involved in cell wall biosynthesis